MKGISLLLVIVSLAACQQDSTADLDRELDRVLKEATNGQGRQEFLLPKSGDLSAIPQDPNNPLTQEKITLGQLLYHETGLALNPMREEGTGTYSCASCHFAEAGFQAGRFQGIGEGGSGFGLSGENRGPQTSYAEMELDVQPIRSPTTLNGAYQELMLWNGQFGATGDNVGTEAQWTPGTPKEVNNLGYEGLETQAIAGLSVHRLEIDPDFLSETGYKTLFDAAFGDWPEETRYTKETAGLAIAAYERKLLANEAPFQRWLQGNSSIMTEAEKRGAILFFGEAGCVSCHSGPALNNMNFYALGMNDLDQCPEQVFQTPANAEAHLGRASFTTRAEDMYKFKTPQLYNLADSPFYGHGASFRTIREVIEYKNMAQPQNDRVAAGQLASGFQPLHLSSSEIDDIVAFLSTALYDPHLTRYEPTALLSGQCFPNNDPQSRLDRGCD
ncbi:MAG: cytochrome-c peroxidase [Lewinella sp.]|nr:cytochrome-c peroxidase [Lewinella sp.]